MHIPQRMCVSCRKRFEKTELIRISKAEDKPIIDKNKCQNGRAIYVCKSERCIDILKKSKAIERFLNIKAEESFYENLKF